VSASSPLARIASARVGTLNAPKIEAVRAALTPYAPDVVVEGVEVSSGVSEQPVGWDEIVTGARNRARGAWASGTCDLAVGIEDGLFELVLPDGGEREVLNVACACVVAGSHESLGFSSAFAYPPSCVEPALAERVPIGDVFDRVFREVAGPDSPDQGDSGGPSGLGTGNIGKLSRGVLTRSDYGRHAVLCALVRFLHPALYDRESPT
jgi:inosine/xanthosine triphosphatase